MLDWVWEALHCSSEMGSHLLWLRYKPPSPPRAFKYSLLSSRYTFKRFKSLQVVKLTVEPGWGELITGSRCWGLLSLLVLKFFKDFFFYEGAGTHHSIHSMWVREQLLGHQVDGRSL